MATGTKAHELDEMTDVDLETRLREAKEELFNLRFQSATERLETPSEIRKAKRELARILTIQRERQLKTQKEAATQGAKANG